MGVVVPGIVRPDRIDYFKQFIRRRTALAIGSTVRTGGFQLTTTQVTASSDRSGSHRRLLGFPAE